MQVGSRTRVGRAGPTEEVELMGRTLAEKVYDAHVVRRAEGEPDLPYIDLHLGHEGASPPAFHGLRRTRRPGRRPAPAIATPGPHTPPIDHPAPIPRPA